MTRRYIVKGLVQGIGYRPFVAKLADELNIDGWARNTGGIVTVLARGSEGKLEELLERLKTEVPTGGFINSIDVIEELDHNPVEIKGFEIINSDSDMAENLPLLPADIATCEKCKTELLDKNNRRFHHPFISCTICGPRYSIIEKLPYDRDTITMSEFDMCDDCKREYIGKIDRRRHAQTIACKSCGPKLTFFRINDENTDNVTNCGKVDNIVDIYNENVLDAEIRASVQLIKDGGILAIKDIGGYHLACDPFNEKAVATLRILKHRENKSFAVMFSDLDQISDYCHLNAEEKSLLESGARPIVLVRRKANIENKKAIADNVCLSSPDIGAMLPCNPVQIMLAAECGPLIMTSGNASGDVLEIDNDRMRQWLEGRVASGELQGVPVAMLSHNRAILRPMDDSVMKVVRGRNQFIRRGRGHVPSTIPVDIKGEIFAAGGDLKSSFCFVKNGLAYPSQYLGDLESVSCQKFYKNEKKAMERIFGFAPQKLVADMHPSYFSIKEAKDNSTEENLPITTVQHHKAHVAAVIAEHHIKGPVLGFAFDGTGYGDDGQVWGGEVFRLDGMGNVERVSHLKPVGLIGGDEGAKNCKTILSGFLFSNNLRDLDQNPNKEIIQAALTNKINRVESTSMGRLFDAVAAMLGICYYNSYEGQAPVELENEAARCKTEGYKLSVSSDGDTRELFVGIAEALKNNVKKEDIAKGFIIAISDFIVANAREQGISNIVLSGGTFLNRILLEHTVDTLENDGFKVYFANQLPAGDGGLCLGQAYLANLF